MIDFARIEKGMIVTTRKLSAGVETTKEVEVTGITKNLIQTEAGSYFKESGAMKGGFKLDDNRITGIVEEAEEVEVTVEEEESVDFRKIKKGMTVIIRQKDNDRHAPNEAKELEYKERVTCVDARSIETRCGSFCKKTEKWNASSGCKEKRIIGVINSNSKFQIDDLTKNIAWHWINKKIDPEKQGLGLRCTWHSAYDTDAAMKEYDEAKTSDLLQAWCEKYLTAKEFKQMRTAIRSKMRGTKQKNISVSRKTQELINVLKWRDNPEDKDETIDEVLYQALIEYYEKKHGREYVAAGSNFIRCYS